MMKNLLLIGISSMLSLNVLSQQTASNNNPPSKRNPEEIAEKRTQKLTEKLNLNADQQSKIKALLTSEIKKTEAQREQHEADRRARMEAARARKNEIDVELKRILTEDQFKKLEEIRKNERSSMRERFKERRDGKEKEGSVDDAY